MGTLAKAVDIAEPVCARFEGFIAKPYLCPAGYWTQGYGTVWKPDGTRVREDDKWVSREQAKKWMRYSLGECAASVLKLSPNLVDKPFILGALADFTYNLGVARYKASTLRKKIAVEDWDGAKKQLRLWVRAGGKKLPGLVKRREAEIQLIDSENIWLFLN